MKQCLLKLNKSTEQANGPQNTCQIGCQDKLMSAHRWWYHPVPCIYVCLLRNPPLNATNISASTTTSGSTFQAPTKTFAPHLSFKLGFSHLKDLPSSLWHLRTAKRCSDCLPYLCLNFPYFCQVFHTPSPPPLLLATRPARENNPCLSNLSLTRNSLGRILVTSLFGESQHPATNCLAW